MTKEEEIHELVYGIGDEVDCLMPYNNPHYTMYKGYQVMYTVDKTPRVDDNGNLDVGYIIVLSIDGKFYRKSIHNIHDSASQWRFVRFWCSRIVGE